jgi:hypothetical protein
MDNLLNIIIPLGPHCCPRMRLDYIKTLNKVEISESNFFDYLMVDFQTILKIIESENIEDIININNTEIYHVNDNYTFINLKNVYLQSIHDVPNINNLNDINNKDVNTSIQNNFINKYIRRYKRLIEKIKNEDIIFIYQSPISLEESEKFYNIISKITTKKIILISFYDFGENIDTIRKHDNLYYLNFNNLYLTKIYEYEASMAFLDWIGIYEELNKIYLENFI